MQKRQVFSIFTNNYPIRIQFDSAPWLVLFVVEDVEFVLLQLGKSRGVFESIISRYEIYFDITSTVGMG